MERLSLAGASVIRLDRGWRVTVAGAGTHTTVDEALADSAWLPAPVPGTVAEALTLAGRFNAANPAPLHDKDAWYVLDLEGETGEAVLRFDGLATIADVYLNGQLLLTSESMFEIHDVPVQLNGRDRLAICFRALLPHLEKTGPRARWRPRMMSHQGLRLVRTTLLGHMPGWCPDVHAVGPYRPISLIRPGKIRISDVVLQSRLTDDGAGHVLARFRASGADEFSLRCNGQSARAARLEDGSYQAELQVDDIEPWFPHTHGRPALYDLSLDAGGEVFPLGKTGFRTVTVDRGADGKGFGLVVNGVPVFCRGAVWTNADILRLPGGEPDYRPLLQLAVDAGMNMIRLGGTMTYESPDFFRLCDELGLLVWQDLMFANFDYPVKDAAFVAHVEREVLDQLRPVSASPSLAVLCGGSEMHQQAAMLGLPKTIWEGPLTEEILPRLAAEVRPDVPYVPNSPHGGAMPFSPNEGVTHYYGVGAYQRPLEDARRANIRFSAESLAFSQVPEQRTLDRHLPVPAVHDPRWKARVPRDRDASWDFEDIRDFYLGELYGVDPARLRREDPARYLDFSRAVTGEVSEAVFAEWRRQGSSCRGGLVWTLSDLMPGAGWGVVDSTGEPKPVWHALKRAFRPLQVVLTDEGTNGLDVHVINEGPAPLETFLELSCLRDGRHAVVTGKRALRLEPRETLRLAATDLFGAFFDTTYAFRFGPPSHDVTVARLSTSDGEDLLADAFHFPTGRSAAFHDAEIEASLIEDEAGWSLILSADRFAQSVSIESETHRAAENWLHLAPGTRRRIRLIRRAETAQPALPNGTIRVLGSRRSFSF